MVTGAQVRLLRQKLAEGKTQEAAAAAADMSVRSARKWARGAMPSSRATPRTWRTREDPLAAHWACDVVPMLEADTEGRLQATTILELLIERYPAVYAEHHLRTLQRRMRDWRALCGPDKEVFFPQEHPPGREGQLDFCHATELGVTIRGELFVHLLFEFILSFSGWRSVSIAFSETFEALVSGFQTALWALGGCPEVVRHDNLSAATHELKSGRGRELTARWRHVLEHYSVTSTRIRPGKANENGVAEKGHHKLKTAVEQALFLRGSCDFASREEYEHFLQGVVSKLNQRCQTKLEEERLHLRTLPAAALPAYTKYRIKVRRWSTVRVRGKIYSVPSRLIGHTVDVRVFAEQIEVYYGTVLVESMPRICSKETCRIDYRHVIWSLVTKPGAFARYRFREELFPSITFRRAYDALCEARGERADIEYVRILHLAASTMESDVERALEELLKRSEDFDYLAVKTLAAPEPLSVPALSVPAVPDLKIYDELLAGGAR